MFSLRRSALLLSVIAGVAATLSVISYEYSSFTASQLVYLSSHEARSNAQIQAHDLSSILTERVGGVSNNLQTITSSRSIVNQNLSNGIPLLNRAQASTADTTVSYSWLDRNGKLLWATTFSGNKTLQQQYQGADFSYRDAFSKPKETLNPYYTTVFEGLNNVQYLQIGYPIIKGGTDENSNGTGVFNGAIIASMNVESLGKFMQNHLLSGYNNGVGLLDRNGIILYSSNANFLGKSIFSTEVQSAVPSDVKDSFNSFIRDSLKGSTGIGDVESNGTTTTIAYEPVTIKGNDFAILYVAAPHQLSGSAVALINIQRLLDLSIIAAIGSVSAGIAALVLIWNKRLSKTVTTKTSELKSANESLAEANRQLGISNSQLSNANEQLKVHDKLQKEFINVAAHELRTPIQPLLAAAELIDTQFDADNSRETIEVSRPEIEMIVRNAKRLERLSSTILEVSRIESGALELRKERFSLALIITEAIKDAKAQSIFDPSRVSITYLPDDTFVYADKEKMTAVITNILSNAVKFTDQGTISITTNTDTTNNLATVTVRDSGKGIDPAIIPKLFEKFVTKSLNGTGIGLYVSKKIVEAHGGKMIGQNNIDGAGATFTFMFPIAQKQMEGLTAEATSQGRSNSEKATE